MAEDKDRQQRIYNLINGKMRYLFKETLGAIEKESKEFNVDVEFFKKVKGRPKGFYAVRKTLLDKGNDILELLSLILGEIEITPKKAKVQITKEVIEQIRQEEKNGSTNGSNNNDS